MIKTQTKYRASLKQRQRSAKRSSKTQRTRRLLFWLLAASVFSVAALLLLFVDFPESGWILEAFFAVAAVLLWIMVYQSHSLRRNAHVQLNISAAEVAPGEAFNIEFEIHGGIDRFRKQTFTLRAREYITVDVSDSIHSETHDQFQSVLLIEQAPNISTAGSLLVEIPVSTMHSINEHSHRFEWHLLWQVKQRGLPNIDDEILLNVSPAVVSTRDEAKALYHIDFADQKLHSLKAGSRIRQTLKWHFDARPDSLEHRVLWIYRSDDSEHEVVIRKTRINAADAVGCTSVDWQLAAGPYSYDGRLMKIDWAVDLIAYPSRESKRQYFSLVEPD